MFAKHGNMQREDSATSEQFLSVGGAPDRSSAPDSNSAESIALRRTVIAGLALSVMLFVLVNS